MISINHHTYQGNQVNASSGVFPRQERSKEVVGIPRGLLYFSYQPLWSTFLSHLGVEIEVSGPTERSHFESSQRLTRSDLCLPVKVFLGHVQRLKDKVDWLLLPRVISVDPDAYMCPKILGLTDMVKNVFEDLPELLDPAINVKEKNPKSFKEACEWVGRHFTDDDGTLKEAWAAAQEAQKSFDMQMLSLPLNEALKEWDPATDSPNKHSNPNINYRVAVIGRNYITHDNALSHDLLNLLNRHGVEIVTTERLDPGVRQAFAQKLPKKVYWQLGKDLVAAAMFYKDQDDVDGIINLSTFGCGQDSFTSALIEHHVSKHSNKPILNLVLDEHTADSGIITRVEAFLDMIDGKKRKKASKGKLLNERSNDSSISEHLHNEPESKEMHLTIPHMGLLHLGFEQVLKNRGAHLTMPPRPNKEAMMLGTRYSPECACLPFKINLGNMIQALESGATDIIVPAGFGPCRYGYYSIIQEQILRNLGYKFRMGRTDDPDSLKDMLATIRTITGLTSKWDSFKLFFFILHRIALVDRALRKTHRARPREKEKRASDQALSKSLKVIEDTRQFSELLKAGNRVRKIFKSVPIDRKKRVVRIGIVGEIFMLLENFANMNVEERLGEMGVEVHRGVWLSDWLNDRFRFTPFRRNQFNWAMKKAKPYLRDPSGGESIKSVAKSIHFARKGFDGIIHLMPFTCMPELVAQTILSRVSSDFDLPILTLIFDEHTSPGAVQTRLEAFVDLIKRRNS